VNLDHPITHGSTANDLSCPRPGSWTTRRQSASFGKKEFVEDRRTSLPDL